MYTRIMTSLHQQEMRQRLELLSVVRIGDKSLQDALSKADLLQLAGALEQESFGAQV